MGIEIPLDPLQQMTKELSTAPRERLYLVSIYWIRIDFIGQLKLFFDSLGAGINTSHHCR